MAETLTENEFGLLALSALMGHFTAEQLGAILGMDPTHVAALLPPGDLIDAPGYTGSFQLSAERAKAELARLRTEHRGAELILHTRAFQFFLARLGDQAYLPSRQGDEDSCLHHLNALFFLITAQMDWGLLEQHLGAARGIALLRQKHADILDYYEGYIAIRTQNYERGEQTLVQLLAKPEIEPDIRLRVARGLAHSYWSRTLYDRAIELHKQIADLSRVIGNDLYRGLALLDMAMNYHELERYEQALTYCLEALVIFEQLNEPHRIGGALYHAGLYSMYLGRWYEAEAYSDRARQLLEMLDMQNALGFVFWLQGFLAHILGDETKSDTAYQRALPIAESPHHGQQSLAMDVHLYLGLLYHTQGRWDTALEHYERALALATQLDRQHQVSLIHFRRAQALHRQGRLADAFAAYQSAIESIEALGGATEGEDIKISLFGTTQQLYEAMVLLCLDQGRPADAFHYIERARSRAFLDTLVKKSPELYDVVAQPVVTLADVQAQLPEGALLLEYFTTGVLPSGEHLLNSIPASNTRLREHLTLPPQVILFAITRDRCEIHRPALNPNSLRPPVGDRYPGRHLLHGRLPQHLYNRLIAPVAELLAGCHMLYLVPHGPLHYVPFTALRSAAGAYLLHANGPALAHAPSATILLRNCIGRPPARGTATLAIGFNDPQGDQPLRYAEAEAQHVARILGGAAWIGMEPKSERLIAAGRDIRWLHIAGHARFNPTDPLGSELYLGSGDSLSARAIIRDLDLAADLVTLSSCTSGVSHVVPGDELLGLQRALLYAGAPTVLCTRWEARDLVSLLVMDLFYTAIQHGQPPGLALRDAQIAVRELTSQELTALTERWDAPDRLTLDAPAEALRDAQSATRELAGLDLSAIRNMWRGEAPDLVAALDQPAVQPSTLESRPFADPLFWAPFMLVGRA